MKRMGGVFWLVALLAVVGVRPASAQSPDRTIWDGVYTEAQATRGQRAAQQNCGSCHSPTEWSSAVFITSWTGHSIHELHSHLRSTMPFDSPGRLTREQYSDIVAYMLKLNDVPTGTQELPSDEEELQRIEVTRKKSR